jgi:hypothetical protein
MDHIVGRRIDGSNFVEPRERGSSWNKWMFFDKE